MTILLGLIWFILNKKKQSDSEVICCNQPDYPRPCKPGKKD